MKRKFEVWFSEKLAQQLTGEDFDETEFDPMDFSLPVMGAWWLVEIYEYISNNPQFITIGFRCSGISAALSITDEDNNDDTDEQDAIDTDDDNEGDWCGTKTTDTLILMMTSLKLVMTVNGDKLYIKVIIELLIMLY